MTTFDPTQSPAGRLARLGVVVDARSPGLESIGRLCDLAGIEIVWVWSPSWGADDDPQAATATLVDEGVIEAAVAVLDGQVARARLGVMGIPAGRQLKATVRESTVGPTADVSGLAPGLRASLEAGRDRREGGRVRAGVMVESMADIGMLLDLVDDIVLPAWRFADLETAADEVRAEAAEIGRDPATLGVAAVLPVSIGRTGAEAAVRADADPVFRTLGHPREIGIFGTLEECQDRVIALAHAGITDLRCILPAAPDVHDVIAQLTAVTVGTTDVLIPGSLRSPAPPPPEGWGGRPERPPGARVSDGSRRR